MKNIKGRSKAGVKASKEVLFSYTQKELKDFQKAIKALDRQIEKMYKRFK